MGPESADLSFPDMEKIAGAYGIPYFAVHNNDEMNVLDECLAHDGFLLDRKSVV